MAISQKIETLYKVSYDDSPVTKALVKSTVVYPKARMGEHLICIDPILNTRYLKQRLPALMAKNIFSAGDYPDVTKILAYGVPAWAIGGLLANELKVPLALAYDTEFISTTDCCEGVFINRADFKKGDKVLLLVDVSDTHHAFMSMDSLIRSCTDASSHSCLSLFDISGSHKYEPYCPVRTIINLQEKPYET